MRPDPEIDNTRARRIATLTMVLALVAAGVAVAAEPASADVPSAPRPIVAVGYKSSLRVYWAPPSSSGGKAITSYKVQRSYLATEKPDRLWTVPTSAMLNDSSAETGVGYRYRIMAINADGAGVWSKWIPGTKVSDRLDLSKFASKEDFITRQFKDFFGRAPTAAELALGVAGLSGGGGFNPATYIEALLRDPEHTAPRLPVIRLYSAYFRRGSDHGGLQYWSAQRKAGTKTLDDVSAAFAASSEFRRTYGSLSDADFIRLVYRNVLGRDPDSTGFNFWTGQLASSGSTRGRMMTKFSESSEFVRVSNGAVLAGDTHDAVLGTAISSKDLALWAAHINGGGEVGRYATYLFTLDAYVTGKVPGGLIG